MSNTLEIETTKSSRAIEECIQSIVQLIDESHPELFFDIRDLIVLVANRSYTEGLFSCADKRTVNIDIAVKKIFDSMLYAKEIK
ncbi:hypothetical protein UFOVP459_53 [uncultured Caudovirales phage]|uniref:Uncharacterized protein n=1 Tax=uncultured Caudovirales phage TaxID=2100421 RepID=A0A6J5SGA1_9CAUD|nr:hypothetical protein UFOVP459_53 [uncultured Caudovirales phage]CAB4182990.1 hypothetical protein UFOVP1089_32 [uncultured Caudovirales phage]CAB4212964.1 hypothetical protein UFOVP1443_51 [uncultured Caudovirales phage]